MYQLTGNDIFSHPFHYSRGINGLMVSSFESASSDKGHCVLELNTLQVNNLYEIS